MKQFFDDHILLSGDTAIKLYGKVKDLPVIDYHCHLNQKEIAADKKFGDIGELWLSADHYKWRAMRLCGIDEYYITGKADFKEKFLKYASVMPKLLGNPLYYFSHLELKQVLGINRPLNAGSAESIYAEANEKLKSISVRKLLKQFNVEYIATTDDPADSLADHKTYGGTTVAPTFRPDKVLSFDQNAIQALGAAAGTEINTVDGLKSALCKRLDYFVSKGCRISDHGFSDFPPEFAQSDEAAEAAFKTPDKKGLRGHLMLWLMREYQKRGMACQFHFSVMRNVNSKMHRSAGADSGFDVMGGECDYKALLGFLDAIPDAERPAVILYSLNPNAAVPLSCISGAFSNVHIGAAWWFNDTLGGIERNLSAVSEYAVLGNNLGMLTDSRSVVSYSRFDFFRRILCNFIGRKVDSGEYAAADAEATTADICYYNIKSLLKI